MIVQDPAALKTSGASWEEVPIRHPAHYRQREAAVRNGSTPLTAVSFLDSIKMSRSRAVSWNGRPDTAYAAGESTRERVNS
jgi:hypothetical protein